MRSIKADYGNAGFGVFPVFDDLSCISQISESMFRGEYYFYLDPIMEVWFATTATDFPSIMDLYNSI
jgi:hypothetical protein